MQPQITHTSSDKIEVIARGVCIKRGQILLCRGRQTGIAYLPGGHIEFRESAASALAREIMEELGCAARVGAFLGCCEHTFQRDGRAHAEINLLFALELELEPGQPLQACEEWLEFLWHPLDQLATLRAEPAALLSALPAWLTGRQHHLVSGTAWL